MVKYFRAPIPGYSNLCHIIRTRLRWIPRGCVSRLGFNQPSVSMTGNKSRPIGGLNAACGPKASPSGRPAANMYP